MTLTATSHPRLARKARLRFDRQTNRYLLLYPEKGLVLNDTAADVLQLCTGEHSVGAMVTLLAAKYGKDAGAVEAEVMTFLGAMVERALVEDGA